MHWWNDGGGFGGWMGFGWIFGVALVAVVFWVLLKSVRSGSSDSPESPEQILKRRYAKGEIDRETYQRMMSELRG